MSFGLWAVLSILLLTSSSVAAQEPTIPASKAFIGQLAPQQINAAPPPKIVCDPCKIPEEPKIAAPKQP